MHLSSFSTKKFTFTLKEQWDITGFQSNKYEAFISPFAFGLLLIQFPSQLFNSQISVFLGKAILLIFTLLRFYKFIIFTAYIRGLGNAYEVEFLDNEIKVKKGDGSILNIPLKSLKHYRITHRIITVSTLQTGASFPIRIFSKEELNTFSVFCKNNLKKNFNLSIWKKIAIVVVVILLNILYTLLKSNYR